MTGGSLPVCKTLNAMTEYPTTDQKAVEKEQVQWSNSATVRLSSSSGVLQGIFRS
jgi:hypothetical protein